MINKSYLKSINQHKTSRKKIKIKKICKVYELSKQYKA